jgi:hypothetical protein
MFQVVLLPHCYETTARSKSLSSATSFVKFWRDYTMSMSEASSIVISRVPMFWWTTRAVSKSPTLASQKSWKIVSSCDHFLSACGAKTV